MHDLTWLRTQVLVALGLSASACGTDAATPDAAVETAAPADTAADTAAQEETAIEPVDGSDLDLAAGASDVVADPGMDAETETATDAVSDAGSDTVNDAATDVSDVPAVPDGADLADLTDGMDADVASWCSAAGEVSGQTWSTKQPFQTCLTAAEILAQKGGPNVGGCPISGMDIGPAAPPDGPYTGPLPPEGCPPVQWGQSNYGQEYDLVGTTIDNGTCCYSFCPNGNVCGRPLIIDQQQRTADLLAGEVWSLALEPMRLFATERTPEHATALAAAWRQDGLDEHASVASFQRCGLELMAFGAPPQLLRAVLTAAADEVRHAELCFGVAAQLDGQQLAPGRLPLGDLRLAGTLAEAAAAAVREGCVGETLAAAHAAAASRRAGSGPLAGLLAEIAADEARHAALAWQFVQWACAVGDHEVGAAARQAFATALSAAPVPRPADLALAGVADTALHAAGRLSAAEAVALYRAALADVVKPAALALLGGLDDSAS